MNTEKQEALAQLRIDEEHAKKEVAFGEVILRLQKNKDFQKLTKRMEAECFEMTLRLSGNREMNHAASEQLMGISRFFNLVNGYIAMAQRSEQRLQQIPQEIADLDKHYAGE